MVAVCALTGKKAIRYVVGQLIEFHTDMTESQRDDSIPVCLNAITLLVFLGLAFVGVVLWLIS